MWTAKKLSSHAKRAQESKCRQQPSGPGLAGTEKNKNKVQKISSNVHAWSTIGLYTTFVQYGSGIVSVGLLKEVGKCQRGKPEGKARGESQGVVLWRVEV